MMLKTLLLTLLLLNSNIYCDILNSPDIDVVDYLKNYWNILFEEYGWNTSLNEACNWEGIRCHDNYIQTIDLSYIQLNGSIPPQLSQLTHLEILRLSNCALHGELSDTLDSLLKLKILDLSVNSLKGLLEDQPFWRLSNLKYLDIHQNQFNGIIPTTHNLQHLTAINLSHNKLDNLILDSLLTFKELKFLHLNYNGLKDTIPEDIGILNSLQQLSLRGNKLSGTIPKSLYSLDQLRYLDLSNNSLSGSISQGLFSIESIQFVDLSYNNWSTCTKENSFKSLSVNDKLECNIRNITRTVDCHYCNICHCSSAENLSFVSSLTLSIFICIVLIIVI